MVETMGASLMAGQVFELEADYAQRTGFTLGTLLLFASQEWEHGAQRLVEENTALRALFARAAPVLVAGELRERVSAAAESTDSSVRTSELQAANNGLRALLIDLHAHAEERDDEAGRALDADIWRELVASTERRVLPGSPF